MRRAVHPTLLACASAPVLVLVLVLGLAAGPAGPAAAQDEQTAVPQNPLEEGGADDVGEEGGFLAPPPSDLEGFLDSVGEHSDSEELIEGIAAQVGNGVVLVSEVRRLAAPVEQRMREAGASQDDILAMRNQALERLIETRIIEDIVRRAQLSATDAEVNNAVAAIARENGLTLDQMKASIRSHGLTLDEYRAKIKAEIERNKVLGSMVRSRVHVEDSEVEALYEERFGKQRTSGTEVHLEHILIGAGAAKMRDTGTACAMAEEVRQRILAGQIDFEAAARQVSDANAERNGDLGWVHMDDLADWMVPAVENLVPGQVSEVIPMYFGCNLLLIVERREWKPVTLAQARPELEDMIFRRKMEEEYNRWIEKIRETVYIERKGVYAEAARVEERSASR